MTGKTGLLAVFSVALSVCHADLANPPRKTIAPDAAHAPGTRTHEGIPSFAASSANGRMWATWYASPTGGEDSNNYLVLATSEDGGRNWREVLVYDPDGAGPLRAFDPEIWVAPDGRLRWTWTERVSPLAAEAKNKYAGCGADPKNDRLVMAELDADVEPDVGALASPGNVREIARGVMMCKPLVTKNGDWILPVAHWGEAPSACVYASNDGGRTFVERGGVTLPKNKRLFDEHQIVQLEDGALRMYVRTKGEPDGIWEATSTDGGRTWSAPFPSALPHVSSRFFVCRLASGGLLMVKNGRPGEPGKGRCDMTAYLSSDDGKTWPHSLVLDAGRNGVSYPDGQQLADGTIAVVYDYDRVGSRQILLATFREEDIVSGKNVSGKLRLRHVVNKASGRPPRDGECIPATRPPGDSVLWPSEKTVLRAQPDSGIASLPDGAMGVTTGVKYQWPGVRMDFAAGACDLSKYGSVKVSVSNITDRTIVVHLGVKGEGREPGGNVRLMPHSSGELFVNLHNAPWVLDAPLKLEGMRGCPKMPDEGSASDLRRTRSFHIFLVQDGKPGGFSVRRVAASGMGVEPKVLPAKTFLPFVDEFGQFAHCDWPGKIHDADELIASRTKEEAWLKEHPCPIPDADKYGGWTGGPRLKATGFFRTEKVNGKWWLVDPEGLLFFSHGVDCVGVGEATGVGFREKYFSWLPKRDDPLFGRFWGKVSWPGAHGFYKDPSRIPFETFDFASANAARKYGRDWWRICAERVHERMRSWGLNTIANWTDCRIYGLRKTPYTANFVTRGPVIEGSSGWWGKFRDPFAPEFAQNAKKSAAEEAARSGEDPWCIGWFVDNELGFGKDDRELGRAVLRSPEQQPAKVAAREVLEKKYGKATMLDAAWGTSYGSWEAFLASTNVPDEKLCGPDLADIHRAVVRRYFSTVRDTIKSVAPNRLYMGSRIAWGHDVVYEECARYCDVVSVNIYDRLPSRDLPPAADDKPMIIGEFHFGALDRGMFHTGLVAASDQLHRAKCYRDYINASIDHPRFVGAHWFQWRDQPLTGRPLDGENYQIGFVTVADVPNQELVDAARDIGATMYWRRYGGNCMASDLSRSPFPIPNAAMSSPTTTAFQEAWMPDANCL